MTFPASMPKTLKDIALTVMVVVSALTWTGWLTPPWTVAALAKIEATAVAQTIREQADALILLNERDTQRERSILQIQQKLDEMAMVLYSLERRSR
jgi:hypothetical protein